MKHALLAALSHPLRRSILRLMSNEVPISPRELADRLDVPLDNVNYHVGVLADCGAIVLVETKKASGTTQPFYRWALDVDWALTALDEPEEDQPGSDS